MQQYRPRSPAVVPQGNATNCAPIAHAADTHLEPVNQGANVCVTYNFLAISLVFPYIFICVHDVHNSGDQ